MGVWAILTVRSEIAAGEYYASHPMSDVFHNATLSRMFYAMWSHVADHNRTFDRIAAYV